MLNLLTTKENSNTHLELVLLPVDNDGGDLLVHEDENGDQQGGQCRRQAHPPGVASERGDEPDPAGVGGLQGGHTVSRGREGRWIGMEDIPQQRV